MWQDGGYEKRGNKEDEGGLIRGAGTTDDDIDKCKLDWTGSIEDNIARATSQHWFQPVTNYQPNISSPRPTIRVSSHGKSPNKVERLQGKHNSLTDWSGLPWLCCQPGTLQLQQQQHDQPDFLVEWSWWIQECLVLTCRSSQKMPPCLTIGSVISCHWCQPMSDIK